MYPQKRRHPPCLNELPPSPSLNIKSAKPAKDYTLFDGGGIIRNDTETLWLFDVTLPILPQLDKAREFLDAITPKTTTGKKRPSGPRSTSINSPPTFTYWMLTLTIVVTSQPFYTQMSIYTTIGRTRGPKILHGDIPAGCHG